MTKKVVSVLMAAVMLLGVLALPVNTTDAATTVTEETLKEYVNLVTDLENKNVKDCEIMIGEAAPNDFIRYYLENTLENESEYDKYQIWPSDEIGSGYYKMPFDAYYAYACEMFSKVDEKGLREYLNDTVQNRSTDLLDDDDNVTVYTYVFSNTGCSYEYQGFVKDGSDYIVYMDFVVLDKLDHKAILTLEETGSGLKIKGFEKLNVVTEELLKDYVDTMTGLEMVSGDPNLEIIPEIGTSWSTPGAFVHGYVKNTIGNSILSRYYVSAGYYEVPFDAYYEYVCDMFSYVIDAQMYVYLTDTSIHGTTGALYDGTTVKVYTGGAGDPSGFVYKGAVKDGANYVIYMDWMDYIENTVEYKAILTLEGTDSGLKIKSYDKVDDYTITNPYKPTDTYVGMDNGEAWAKITLSAAHATMGISQNGNTPSQGIYLWGDDIWYSENFTNPIQLKYSVDYGYKFVRITSSKGDIKEGVTTLQPVLTLEKDEFGPITVTAVTEEINTNAVVTVPNSDETQENLAECVKSVIDSMERDEDVSEFVDDSTKEALQEAVKEGSSIATEVRAEAIKDEDVEEEDAAEIMKLVTDTGKVVHYINIEVVLLKDGTTEIGTLNKLSSPLTFEIEISEDLSVDGRKFYIVRVHDGVAEKLPLIHVEGNKYSFQTNLFSTYALVYEEATEVGGTDANVTNTVAPKTGDSTSFVWILFAVVAMGVIVVMISKKRCK